MNSLEINNKINELRIKSISLRNEASLSKNYEKAKELREKQDKTYKEFLFFKELRKVLQ